MLLYDQKYDYIEIHLIGMQYTHTVCVFMYNHIRCFIYSNISETILLLLLFNQKYDYIVIHMIGMQYTHTVCVFMYNHIRCFIYSNISETMLLYNENRISMHYPYYLCVLFITIFLPI